MPREAHPTFNARTLEELPTHLAHYGIDPFGRTCLSMLSTGIHKWGFVIYRCTYDDDGLWDRYLAQLKSLCHDDLVEEGRAELLEPYLDWIVIEDRATLDNASRVEVRKHFNQWLSKQNIPLLPTNLYLSVVPMELPRFRYCLYVDKQCLDTVIQFQKANDGTDYISQLPPMVFAVIDRTWTPDGPVDEFDLAKALKEKDGDDKEQGANEQGANEQDGGEEDDESGSEEEESEEEEDYDHGHPLIDGSDRRYVGWVYCGAHNVVGLYETLYGMRGLDDEDTFHRPPRIWTRGSMPA
ncbi:hypothetical protein CPLU01_13645 [Colletotrichum plurivorum]|uniref:Uncharacterized protein n=1 Tax=Colletotrichum plurivorum TaxID=2175906 RepID=A0A8H6JQM5_9PEZI|nr:hypothetical protein CPLU01_13645 [Colletotrichum plurivorum]